MRRSIFAAVAGIALATGSTAASAQTVVVETYVAPAYPSVVYEAPPVAYYDAPVYAPRTYYRVRRYYDGGSWQVPRRVNCDSRYRLGECVIDRSQSGY